MAIVTDPSTGGVTTTKQTSYGDSMADLPIEGFFKLILAELQNQDPLSPTDNQALLEQIGSMREIASSDKLTETMDAVLTGQNMTTAGILIGSNVKALAEDGTEVQGTVERAVIDTSGDNRTVKVYVGDKAIKLSNIREILPFKTTE